MNKLELSIIHDKLTRQHSQRVSLIVRILAEKMNEIMPDINCELLSQAALYHDIGKSMIPNSILNKQDKLSEEEFAIMKSHSQKGADIIQSFASNNLMLKTAYEIARWHHERYDGRGYPDNLKGNDIPLAAQITSIADAYDALTSERPYKKQLSPEIALEMIINGKCGCFNPSIVNCFIACQAQIESYIIQCMK